MDLCSNSVGYHGFKRAKSRQQHRKRPYGGPWSCFRFSRRCQDFGAKKTEGFGGWGPRESEVPPISFYLDETSMQSYT